MESSAQIAARQSLLKPAITKENLKSQAKHFSVSLRKKKRTEAIARLRFIQEKPPSSHHPILINDEELSAIISNVVKLGQNNPEDLGRVFFRDFYEGLKREGFFRKIRTLEELDLVPLDQVQLKDSDVFYCHNEYDGSERLERAFLLKMMLRMCAVLADFSLEGFTKEKALLYKALQESEPELLCEVLDGFGDRLQNMQQEAIRANFEDSQIMEGLMAKLATIMNVQAMLPEEQKQVCIRLFKLILQIIVSQKPSLHDPQVLKLIRTYFAKITPEDEDFRICYLVIYHIVDNEMIPYVEVRETFHFCLKQLLASPPDQILCIDLPVILWQIIEKDVLASINDLKHFENLSGVLAKLMYLIELVQADLGTAFEKFYFLTNLLSIIGAIEEQGGPEIIWQLLNMNLGANIQNIFYFGIDQQVTDEALLLSVMSVIQGITVQDDEELISFFFKKTKVIEEVFERMILVPVKNFSNELYMYLGQILQNLSCIRDSSLMGGVMSMHFFEAVFTILAKAEDLFQSAEPIRDCLEAVEKLFAFHSDHDLLDELIDKTLNTFFNGTSGLDILYHFSESYNEEIQETASNILSGYFGFELEDLREGCWKGMVDVEREKQLKLLEESEGKKKEQNFLI